MPVGTENGRKPVNGKRTGIILVGLVLAVVVLAAFVSLRRSQVPIRVAHAERQTLTASIATNGKIEALNNFEAHAPMATTVKKVLVQQGQWVKPGQPLLQLEDATARLQAARAEAQLKGAQADITAVEGGGTKEEVLTTQNALVKAQADRDAAQRNLEAMKRLLQTGAASQGEVDAAQNQLQVADSNVHYLQQKLSGRYSQQEKGHVEAQQAEARASLAAAQQLLHNSNVSAPRGGIVYSLPVQPGGFVNAGDLLVQVADLHKVRVRAFIDEPDIGKLQKGQEVEVTWDALGGKSLEGETGDPANHGGAARDPGGRRSDLRGGQQRSQTAAQHQCQRSGDHGARGKRPDRSPGIRTPRCQGAICLSGGERRVATA